MNVHSVASQCQGPHPPPPHAAPSQSRERIPHSAYRNEDLVPGIMSAAPKAQEGPMLDQSQQQAIGTRLNRIEGQVRGIRRMVQEPRLCVEILQQLAAAEAALNRISLSVFRFHVEKCVPDGIEKGDPERTQRLSELVDIFDRFAK